MSNARVVVQRASLWTYLGGPILTLVLAILLEILARTSLYIPIPAAFLILAIVFSAISGGYRSGLISAAIAWIYIAYFFSQPTQPFQYTDDSLRHVIVLAAVMPFIAVMVSYLNRWTARALAQAEIAAIKQNQLEEHIRARQALEASEQRNRMLIEQASDGIFVADTQGRFLDVNPRGCEMLGYTREELLRLNMADLIPREDLVSQPIRFDELRAGKILVSERRLKRKDNILLQVEISAKMLPDGRLQGIVRDITERRRAEEALRESEERYRTVITGVPIILFAIDCEGIITLSEGKGLEGLGLRPGQLVGASVFDIYQDRPDLLANCRRALTGERFTNVVETGGIFLETQWAPLHDSNGSLVGTIGVSSDITERKRAEEALRASEARFRTFVDHAADAFFLFDDQGRILDVNRQACENLGYTREELIGVTPVAFDPYANPSVLARINTRLEAGETFTFETRHRRKDGTVFPVEVHSRPFGQGGRRFGVALARDITERKRSEEQLAASEAELRALFAAMTDVVMVLDQQGRYLKIAPTNPQLLYRPAADLIGKGLHDVFPTSQADYFLTQIQAALANKQAIHFEYDLTIEGKETWFAATVSPMTNETVVYVARDITERKRAEEALRESEERYRSVITGAPIILYAIDRTGVITLSEGKGLESLGFQPGQLVGESVMDLYQDRPDLLAIFQRALTGERFTNVAELGGIFLETQWAPLYDTSGLLVGTIGISSDITERKQAEEALQKANQDYMSLVNSVDGIVWECNAQTFAFSFVSHQAERLLGYPVERWLIEPTFWKDHIHPEDRDRAISFCIQSTREKRPHEFEYRMLAADERIVWLRDMVTVVVENDQPLRLRGIMVDITGNKQAEENLYHRLAELEAISRISVALRTAETLDEMLPILLDETLSALNSTAGSISLYEPENDILRITVARGWFEQLRESPIKPSEGIAGTVFATGQTHISREFATDLLTHSSAIGSIPRGWGGICVPIRAAAEVVGVLFVSVLLPREIAPGEAKLLSSLAAMAGTAMHRLRLHEETVRHLENLQALHTVDRAITASLDSRLILNVLLEQVSARLGVDAAGVLLFNSQSLTLEYAAGRGFRTENYERSYLRLGEGMAGGAALERRIIQTDNVLESAAFMRAGLLRGEGFTTYIAVPFVAKGQVKGVLEVFHRTLLRPDSEWYGFLDAFAHQAAIAIDNIQLFEGLQRSNRDLMITYDATIEGWGRALELRDQETEGHTQRVTEMTERLARALDISDKELIHIRRGALLHDIGKMGVPDGILLKPGPLNEAEWAIMRLHPQYAFEMLASIPYLHLALDIPYCHHEKWDGTGYPRGLVGDQIPSAARIFAVVDVWDALRSDRPYRRALPEDKVFEYIREQAGRHFDPKVVEQFLRMMVSEKAK